jgi:hypothetical protein
MQVVYPVQRLCLINIVLICEQTGKSEKAEMQVSDGYFC